jgi:hypothetical protein
MTLQQFLQLNPQFQANPNLIKPGQVVNISQQLPQSFPNQQLPQSFPTPQPTQPQGGTYSVPNGSNLSASARAMGITLQQLLDANPQYKANPNMVQAGAALNYPTTTNASSPVNSGKTDPKQPLTDAEYDAGLASNPVNAARIAKGNTAEALAYAASSGDLSGLVNEYGQPFSLQDQQDALKQGMEDNKLFYEAQQAKEKADAESALAKKQANYQDYLISSGESFAADKSKLDQNAANTGMLFSTSRKQKEQKLQSSYQQEQASKLASYGKDIGDTARNYQYNYGNDSANGLSQYYNAPTNAYNPNVATGGVTSGGLSSIYNPSQFNFQGTQNVAQKVAANQRAAGYLANKGNKLLATGYNNQL